MKTKPGFKIRPLGKEFIVVGEGVANINFNKMIALNDTAAYLWKSVEGKEFDPETLSALLLEKYDVESDRALADSKAIAQAWIEAGIAED